MAANSCHDCRTVANRASDDALSLLSLIAPPFLRARGRVRARALTHRSAAERTGRNVALRLKEVLSRQQFDVAIQACVGSKVLARETIKAVRKNVLVSACAQMSVGVRGGGVSVHKSPGDEGVGKCLLSVELLGCELFLWSACECYSRELILACALTAGQEWQDGRRRRHNPEEKAIREAEGGQEAHEASRQRGAVAGGLLVCHLLG